ncbi:MAG: sigma 54-interacting transcriptional regulator, partial [Bacteroidota bacterium]
REIFDLAFHSLEQSKDMIFWLKPDASFHYFNDAFCQATGYSRSEVEEMNLLDFFPTFTLHDFQDSWEQLRLEHNRQRELEITCKDGSTLPVAASVSLFRFGQHEYSSTFLRDITEQKQREAQLQKLLEENQELNKKLSQENIILKEEIRLEYGDFPNIVSVSKNYRKVLAQVEQVAGTDATVLILGETGTGKELLAKAIHHFSERSDQPMVKVNCAALPENLIESELFGHEKGAFTGAVQRKPGRFELAHKGTLFLDEIGDLPLELQVKLLRVLQEGEFERVGGTQTIKVDVRLIAATNRNLEEYVEEGKFREDLFYRLYVFPIYNLPLRERKEDIPALVRHFVEKFNHKLGKHVEEIPSKALEELTRYEFPGNVRELENLIERAMILSKGKTLAFQVANKKTPSKKEPVLFKTLEEMERTHILEALRRSNGKVSGKGGAADLLDINDKTLNSRMVKLGVGRFDYQA